MNTQTYAAGDIQSRAMLAGIKISKWEATIHDSRITQEVADKYKSNADFGRYQKKLVKKSALADIAQCAGEARRKHYYYTLPWMDDGMRILPSSLFIKYTNEMTSIETKFWNAYDKLEAAYDSIVEEGKAELNGLFRLVDYPAKSELRNRYAYRLLILPVSDANDFRVDMNQAVVDKIKREMQTELEDTFRQTQRDCFERLMKVVQAMNQRLKIFAVRPDGSIEHPFRNSMVENVSDACDLLDHLNITDNGNVSGMVQAVRDNLLSGNQDAEAVAETIRDSDIARQAAMANAEAIMRDMAGYMSGYGA